jgi:phosphatidylethanolamine-binding protein (PEBP) family uncharacterized protein
MAIVMDDSDSPFGFVHWPVYDIPGEVREIPEGASSQKNLPLAAMEGLGSAVTSDNSAYCPPGPSLTTMPSAFTLTLLTQEFRLV